MKGGGGREGNITVHKYEKLKDPHQEHFQMPSHPKNKPGRDRGPLTSSQLPQIPVEVNF
jgi:hypothetical protein